MVASLFVFLPAVQPAARSNRGVGSAGDFCFLAMVTSFSLPLMIENTAPTKILMHKNVHIYFSLMTLLSEQTLSTGQSFK